MCETYSLARTFRRYKANTNIDMMFNFELFETSFRQRYSLSCHMKLNHDPAIDAEGKYDVGAGK